MNYLSFLRFLAILFIAMRLFGYINWSWVWVLAPIWGGLIYVIILIIVDVFTLGLNG